MAEMPRCAVPIAFALVALGCKAVEPVAGADASSCSSPMLMCDQQCVNPMDDEQHCGDCTTACRGDQECVAGDCACPTTERR
jgi:hypothetical protein